MINVNLTLNYLYIVMHIIIINYISLKTELLFLHRKNYYDL